jgi:two-component system, NtrC family, response regulator AtoC
MEATQTTSLPIGNVTPDSSTSVLLDVSKMPTMAELEREYLMLVLKNNGGSKTKAAKILGFSVKTIYNKLDEYKASEAVRTNPQGS